MAIRWLDLGFRDARVKLLRSAHCFPVMPTEQADMAGRLPKFSVKQNNTLQRALPHVFCTVLGEQALSNLRLQQEARL